MTDITEFIPDDKKKKMIYGKIAELLETNGIEVDDIGSINKVNLYQGFYKDEEGEAHVVDLASLTISPSWSEGPQWPVIQPAKPTVVKHNKIPTQKTSVKTTGIVPDPQIGFWRLSDGTMVPMHDERAMETTLQILANTKPNVVCVLGDFLDASEWSSKFVTYPEFVLTTQAALDAGHLYLARIRAAVGPDAVIYFLEGNHDKRIELAVVKNTMAALRLRQANAPESWPVLSLPFLLRFDELGIEYIGAYPAGRVKLAEAHGEQTPLYALHGEKLDMKKQANAERQSTVQGHTHHVSMHSETYEYDGTPQQVQSWTMGCLCRIDGAVPSTRGGVDMFGMPYKRQESWQHAMAVVVETENGWWLEPIFIHDGVAYYNGNEYGNGKTQG